MGQESAQQKGKDLEKMVAKRIQRAGLGAAKREIGSGSGKKKGDIAANLPFLLECKNQPSVKIQTILNWVDQAKEQARVGNYDLNKWALVVRDPRTPEENPEIYVTVELDEFLELIKKDSEPRIKAPDRQLKYDIMSLKLFLQRVLKQL